MKLLPFVPAPPSYQFSTAKYDRKENKYAW